MKSLLILLFFSKLIFGNIQDALPVELLYFNAEQEDSSIFLSWGTATENNNFGFVIERTINLNEWNNLGFVEGAGNSNTPINYSFRDTTPQLNISYYYRLKQVDTNGDSAYSDTVQVDFLTAVNDDIISPINFYLYQNYPNPFNSQTTIKFSIPTLLISKERSRSEIVTLKVYDMLGREITVLLNEEKSAGDYEIIYDAAGLTSGIYFYSLTFSSFSETKKLILLK